MFGIFKKKSDEKSSILKKKKNLRKFSKEKKYSQALSVGKDILLQRPNDEDVLFIVGSIYYLKGQYKTAIHYFDKALEIGEYDTEVLLLKANSHFKLGNKKQAKDCCTKILEVDSKNKAVAELLSKTNK